MTGHPVIGGVSGRRRRPASVASRSRICATVHSGASNCGAWPTSGATANRQAGFCAAAARAAASGTSLCFSPCRRSTGASIPASSAQRRRLDSSHSSDRAATRILTKVRAGQSVASGPYAVVKHPLCARRRVAPWLGFLFDSWLGAALGVAPYAASRRFAPDEEAELAGDFGAAWDDYRDHVMLPWL